jgi:hypothetical protein
VRQAVCRVECCKWSRFSIVLGDEVEAAICERRDGIEKRSLVRFKLAPVAVIRASIELCTTSRYRRGSESEVLAD